MDIDFNDYTELAAEIQRAIYDIEGLSVNDSDIESLTLKARDLLEEAQIMAEERA